jgi:hypothetical protein
MSPPRQPTEVINRTDERSAEAPSGVAAKDDGNTNCQQVQLNKDVFESDPAGEPNITLTNNEGEMDNPQAGLHNQEKQLQDLGKDFGTGEKAAEPMYTNAEDDRPPAHDPMESSTATLKPDLGPSSYTSRTQQLSPDERTYLDPTPRTPISSEPPSRSTSSAASIPHYGRTTEGLERSPTRSDAGFDEKNFASEDEPEVNSRSELQSIMDQFSEEGQGPGHEAVMSPRLEFAGPLLGSPIQHPPRKSSLEPLNANTIQAMQDLRILSNSSPSHQMRNQSDIGPTVPPKPGSIRSFGQTRLPDDRYATTESPLSPPLHRPPPPEPEPEPDLPFDFHRFLEQLRHRTADPVAKFLRSFLQEFGKKQWMVHEQVKIIGDFLAFITNKMAQCEVWREVSDAEFDNAREGMEKLVMNRLYTQTFSPAIPPPQPIPGSKPKRKGAERPMGPGRRGQHQEDVERDDILAQKVSIYGWVKEEHLDILPVGDSGKRFLVLAQQGRNRNKLGNEAFD